MSTAVALWHNLLHKRSCCVNLTHQRPAQYAIMGGAFSICRHCKLPHRHRSLSSNKLPPVPRIQSRENNFTSQKHAIGYRRLLRQGFVFGRSSDSSSSHLGIFLFLPGSIGFRLRTDPLDGFDILSY